MQWLVLEDFAGNLGGPTNASIVGAGTLLDDTQYDIQAIIDQGCPLIRFDADLMSVLLDAFQRQGGGVAQISPDGNLLGLLIAFNVVPYKPANLAHWNGNDPRTIAIALDRIAAKIGPIL